MTGLKIVEPEMVATRPEMPTIDPKDNGMGKLTEENFYLSNA